MTLRQYLVLMTLATSLCWLTWFFAVFNIDPDSAGFIGFAFFYLSLFLGIVGLFSVIGFIWKNKKTEHEDAVFRQVKKTFIQGILFGTFVNTLLILLQFNFLYWWNAALLSLFYLLLEGAIISGRKYHNRDYV